MATLVSLVLNNADRLPIVGSPIGQATTWYRRRSNSNEAICEIPPPPYEKEPVHSRLTQISDYVWKRASFSSGTQPQEIVPIPTVTSEQILDKKQVDEGISLLQMASHMNQDITGKHNQMSIDLYMMGLDKILASIPINSDPSVKATLENKLSEFKKRNGLVLNEENENKKRKLTEVEQKEALGGLSDLVIHAAVLGAIALKKSSLPGIFSRAFQLTKDGLLKIDETCSIRERTLNLTSVGLSKALELDKHYEVHQFFAEIFYTGCTAVLKASIAYAEQSDLTTTAAAAAAADDATI
ncbi:hypothetical protein INT47_006644 [Mucor saturninus]|uniref:Uncharacterized protein n=1 Tax=Mucor saturninus TaxID=64648 RepID=A0A8H7QJA1_9FUNG|nr:hypothetical protein INT47_006644 [Mucor saturninus]